MNEKEFNLIDEPWIRVRGDSCEVVEASLMEVIVNAHRYKCLSGELPTQDVAVMRLILAVLHTIVSRYDAKGDAEPLEDSKKAALKRWGDLWEQGYFPENAVREYLAQWHERFWLFHYERPFGQVAGLFKGTKIGAEKLNGELSQSNNKIRFFPSLSGDEKTSLSYSQAARWVIYHNAYDDVSLKGDTENKIKAGGKLPSAKRGWLGQLGLVYLNGKNLFETLMLNLVMICEDIVQCQQNPLWEAEKVSDSERTIIDAPINLAELYTVQFRRILLDRKEGKVIGCKNLVGDIFNEDSLAFREPMTTWIKPKKSDVMVPRKHDSSKQMWREFAVLYNEKDNNHRAGVIKWYNSLYGEYGEKYFPKSDLIKTTIVSLVYNEKQATSLPVINVFSDTLTMHSAILSELGKNWRSTIETEIDHCKTLADEIAQYAKRLYIASGGSDNDTEGVRNNAKSQLYFRLDMPFREWLGSIIPDNMKKSEKIDEWHKKAERIVFGYADELMENAPECAIIGHKINNKIYSSPKARNILNSEVRKIYERK